MRDLELDRVQVDEVWAFVYAKERNVPFAKRPPSWAGTTYTWTAMDADSRLFISWLMGTRSPEYADMFMADLASRISGRVQITSDGLQAYLPATQAAFGDGCGSSSSTPNRGLWGF